MLKLTLLGVGLLIVAAGAIVADAYYQAYKVYKEASDILPNLESARASLARGQVPSGDPFAAATSVAAKAQADIQHARFTFALTGSLPFLGRPIDAVRLGVSAAEEEATAASLLRDMVVSVLGDSAIGQTGTGSGTGGAGSHGAPVFRDGVVDVKLIQGLTPKLEEVIAHLQAGERLVRAIPSLPFVHQLSELKARAIAESVRATALAQRGLAAIKLLPSFLGANGPRTYFLAMQQNAALRGTGGSVLAFAFVKVTNGQISLDGLGPISSLDTARSGVHVKLPPAVSWYISAAKVNPRIANGVDYSPDFPTVAQAWQAQVKEVAGKHIDGVLALDPVAMAYLLKPAAPIRIHAYDKPITAANVVSLTENEQFRLPHAQQAILPGELIHQAFNALIHPKNFVATLHQLGTALSEKHVQIWAAGSAQGAYLRSLGWDGALQAGSGDFVDLVQENRYSNKLDYYAHQTVTYTARVREDGSVASTYQVVLSNDVPPGQPDGISGPHRFYEQNRAMMNLYVPKRAKFTSVTPVDGPPKANPPGFVQHLESAFRVFTQTIQAGRGEKAPLTFRYTVPGVVQTTDAGKLYQLAVAHVPMVYAADFTVKVILPAGTTVVSAPGWTVTGNVATFHGTLTRDLNMQILF